MPLFSIILDVNDLQIFVNLALDKAEDDYAKDMLYSLCIVGSGYGSLIYQIDDDMGFRELYKKCSSVWTAYRDNEKLPKILVDGQNGLYIIIILYMAIIEFYRYHAIRVYSGMNL